MEYHSKQVIIDDILFDSVSESLYYLVLKKREKMLEISDLQVHKSFIIIPNFIYKEKEIKATQYTPDFVYYDKTLKKWYAVEIKGIPTRDYELRVKLFKWQYGKQYEHQELTYTKTLGFKESKESKKLMKQVRNEKLKERAIKQDSEKRAKQAIRQAKAQEIVNKLSQKKKLSKNEQERLERNTAIIKGEV